MSSHDPGILAQRAGVCPLCSKLIAAGRSRIVALPVALIPGGITYAGRGRWTAPWSGDPVVLRVHARPWAHEKCAARLTPDDLTALAAERREDFKRQLREARTERRARRRREVTA